MKDDAKLRADNGEDYVTKGARHMKSTGSSLKVNTSAFVPVTTPVTAADGEDEMCRIPAPKVRRQPKLTPSLASEFMCNLQPELLPCESYG